VPMPIPIRSRRYDASFWESLLKDEQNPTTFEDASRSLGFEDDDTD